MKYIILPAAGAALVFLMALAPDLRAQDKVKYCKNPTTGAIITVSGAPCPFGTFKI